MQILKSLYFYFYHKNISIDYLYSISTITKSGISLNQMCQIASSIGVKIVFYKMHKSEFENYTILNPIISIIKDNDQNHFILIYKQTKTNIYYSDPATGKNHKIKKSQLFLKIESYIFGISNKENNRIVRNKMKTTIFELLKNEINNLIIIILINLILISLTIVASLFGKILIDYLLPNYLIVDLLVVSTFFIFINIFKNVVVYVQNKILKNILLNFNNKLSKKFLLNLDQKSHNFNNNFNDSSIIRKTQLISGFGNFIVIKITNLFSNILLFLALLIFLFFVFNIFTLVLLLFFIFFVIINLYFKLSNHSLVEEQQLNTSQELNDRLPLIYLRNNVKTANKNSFLKQRWWASFIKLQNKTNLLLSISNKRQLINSSLKVIINFLFITLASILIIKQNLSVGSIIVMINVLGFMWNPLNYFSNFINSLNKEMLNYRNISKVLNAPNESINEKGFIINKIVEINFINLTFKYDSKIIFNKLNLKINNHLFIKSKNGSGKSTLLRLIASIQPSSKSIKINDQYIESINLKNYRLNIILLTSKYYFIEELIQDLLIKERFEFWNKIFNKYHIWLILKILKINLIHLTKENWKFLSLGQKQILNFLIFFKQKFLLILADEVLSNVDHRLSNILFSILLKFQKNSLIIIASHHNNPNKKLIQNFNLEEANDK